MKRIRSRALTSHIDPDPRKADIMKRFAALAAVLFTLLGPRYAGAAERPFSPPALKPVLLAVPADLPDVAECRGILSQVILALLDNATEDPGETFELNRRAHPNMIMMPPPLDCASKLWGALKRQGHLTKFATVPAGTDPLSLPQ